MKPARRTILKVLALFTAGAAFNVTVAWGLCIKYTYVGFGFGSADMASGRFAVAWADLDIFEEPWLVGLKVVRQRDGDPPSWPSRIVDWTSVDQRDHYDNGRVPGPYTDVDCGFPCLAMTYSWPAGGWERYKGEGPISWEGGVYVRVPATLDEQEMVHVPLRPIWPGFAINTLFYAGVLWMLFAGPFALRRMIRRRRGRCAACNYPIGQSPVCTECGASVMLAKAGIQRWRGNRHHHANRITTGFPPARE